MKGKKVHILKRVGAIIIVLLICIAILTLNQKVNNKNGIAVRDNNSGVSAESNNSASNLEWAKSNKANKSKNDKNKAQDFALRMFISRINLATQTREPKISTENGAIEYKHTKQPINVKKDDKIEYTIRVYNEGEEDGCVNKVSVHIPEGLTFDKEEATNSMYLWQQEENGKLSTDVLSEKIIVEKVGYKDICLILKVDENNTEDVKRLNVVAQIEEQSGNDSDSTPGNMFGKVDSNYKKDEIDESTADSYIKGQEDDDDFECVLVDSNNVNNINTIRFSSRC